MASSGVRFIISISFILLIFSPNPTAACIDSPLKTLRLAVDPADAAVASNITSDALVEAKHILRAAYETSITQAHVATRLEAMMRAEGADGDLSFPTLVMSGYELTIAHGNPLDDASHIINPDVEPVVMIDIGCKYNGHCTDVTRTFFFESATQEMLDAYSAVLSAEEAVIAAISPGVRISDLDAIMEVFLEHYKGVPGMSLLTYWGHGVGEYVHEEPILYNTVGELAIGDVIAIEPGIYCDDGWAVRVEDTVRVTATGVEVLSNTPKNLESVMVLQNQPYVDTDVGIANYDYGSEAFIAVHVDDSASRSIVGVDWFNGYSWIEMDYLYDSYFSLSYSLNYSYSGHIVCLVRVHFSNDTYYFDEIASATVEASEQIILDPVFKLNDTFLPPNPLIVWSHSQPGAEMIRIHFHILNGGLDQFLIEDSSLRVVLDYRNFHKMYVWTPWLAGDTLRVHVIPTEPDFLGGVDSFSFTIDKIEYFDMDLSPTSTTTPTNPTETTTPPETITTTETPTSTTPLPDTFPEWLSPMAISSGIIIALVVLVAICIRRQ